MVCVKGHLCGVCKSSSVKSVSQASSLTDDPVCVDVTVTVPAGQEPVKCDCFICQTKTLTPDPLSPSVKHPSTRISSSPIPISPPSSPQPPTSSLKRSPPRILNPQQDITSSGFLTPGHLQSLRLSQKLDMVSPVLSMVVEPPTPLSSLLSPSLSLTLSSPTPSTTPLAVLEQVPATPPPIFPHSMSPDTSSCPIQPTAQSPSAGDNSRLLNNPTVSLNVPTPEGHTLHQTLSPPSSLVSLASLRLQDLHSSPASITSTLLSSSKASPPLSSTSSPVCSYFNYVDADDYFDLLCNEEVESTGTAGTHEGRSSSTKLTVTPPRLLDSTHKTVRKKLMAASDSPATGTAVTEPPNRTVTEMSATQTSGDIQNDNTGSIPQTTVLKSPPNTSKLYRNHSRLTPHLDTATKLKKNTRNIVGTLSHRSSFTVHIPLHILPQTLRKRLRKNQRTVVQFLRERGLKQKFPRIILTRVSRSHFHSSVTSSL